MTRTVRIALAIAAASASAAAQAPLQPGARMPPGHPQVAAASEDPPAASSGEAPPAGSGTAASENGNKTESLPPGHPDMPPGHPEMAAPQPQREALPQDALMAVESLPSGTVEVEVRDPSRDVGSKPTEEDCPTEKAARPYALAQSIRFRA